MDINVQKGPGLNRVGAVLLLLMIKSISTDGAMFCYHGNDVNSLSALRNESCSTKELHIPKILMSDDQQTSEAPLELKQTKGNTDSHSAMYWSGKHTTPLCYIFRHISTAIYASGVKDQTVNINFGCDFGHLCSKKELNKVLHNVTATGQDSLLFCCSGDNCNTVDKLPHMENQMCYHGTNNVSDSPTAEVRSCSQPDVSCARKTTFLVQGKIEDYFCDNERSCSEQMSSGAFRSCTNTTVGNLTQELCCCNKNNCFVPQWFGEHLNNTVYPVNVPPSKPMGNTIEKPEKKKTSTALVTGMVSAIVIMVGFAGGIIIVAACKKKKSRRRDPNVIMQYERLSVSDAEIEDAVVL